MKHEKSARVLYGFADQGKQGIRQPKFSGKSELPSRFRHLPPGLANDASNFKIDAIH
jgi:hypothetical protein